MPDRNKLQVYQDEHVSIVRTCASCAHATFPHPQASWGDCAKHSYVHAKHDPKPRPLPAHVLFLCSGWDPKKDLLSVRELGAYADLLEKT